MAHKFLATNVEDLELGQNLLILFSGRLDLCLEFKRLYVYGHCTKVADTTKKNKILDTLLKYVAEKVGDEGIVQDYKELTHS